MIHACLIVLISLIFCNSISFADHSDQKLLSEDKHWGSALSHQHAPLAEDQHQQNLHRAVVPSNSMTLSTVLEHAVQYSPDYSRIVALQKESIALKQRGESYLGKTPTLSAWYTDDQPFGNKGYLQATSNLQLPLWNWGQREAGQQLGRLAEQTANAYPAALLWEVAGIVREALWNIALQHGRLEKAEQLAVIAKKRLHTIERRVEVGDLARADLLLAQSELLAHQSRLQQAEASFVDANVHYIHVTGLTNIPVDFSEQQSQRTTIM
ncbi:MAG TPA: hypothetical protein ENJ32_07915, partial [Crenotrichaceae bacterium]|nr:hypothetical protein [Crenotrichaceae bacterium]